MNAASEKLPGSATHLMMVRPACFGYDEETAATNAFQLRAQGGSAERSAQVARDEFDGLVDRLRDADVPVIVFEDTPEPVKPGAVFPNNWVSFHGDGTVVLYPMATPGRRAEVQLPWIEGLGGEHGFRIDQVIDWRPQAEHGRFLEGTGSLVLDRARKQAYASLSPRTDLVLARQFANTLGYELISFRAVDPGRAPIYHTNVLLSVGPTVALACFEAIPDRSERGLLRERLGAGERIVIDLTWDQLCGFAGNVLEVRRASGLPVLVMSSRAREVLAGAGLEALEGRVQVVHAPIPCIERLGGGSARCMIAAIHLPRRPGRGMK
ncbi:MAG: hypothetical protein ACI8QZ_000171 [Chlamydiales bacterium]|jgi:hypothetical protein